MNPWGYISAGLIGSVVGGVAIEAGSAANSGWVVFFGLVIAALCGVVTLIGVIAEGIRVGLREVGLGPDVPAVDRVEQR